MHGLNATLATLLRRLEAVALQGVIPWSCPVPSFGDLSNSRVATLGLNPSNREFVDGSGNELDGESRRFHTLKSLGLSCWADASDQHLEQIVDTCRAYFHRNPYDGWFKRLDQLISGTRASYYDNAAQACHLDLIPYATICKWTDLTKAQRSVLMVEAGDTLGLLIRESPIKVLVLNGNSVVANFEEISGVQLGKEVRLDWSLPRQSVPDVPGFSYKGTVQSISGIELDRELLVLGYNHNIQSSFGVTTHVMTSIRRWIAHATKELFA